MVFEHEADYPSQWAAIDAIAPKIGCTPETLRSWVRQAECDAGRREGTTTSERERIKALERENRELKQANEILRKASAYFAQTECDGQAACAAASDDRVHRRSPGVVRGRADLPRAADRPGDLLRAQGP